jgi:3-hydroxyisobutyrate dehydrogenase-like beta-hydroxyacid dehydrogenase
MNSSCIGVIGIGEVGLIFCHAIAEQGVPIKAYDLLLEQDEGHRSLKSRIRHAGIELTTLQNVIACSEVILSVVTTQTAVNLTRQVSELIQSHQTYVDMNSTSPSVKKEIGRIIGSTGAFFVEGAILGAVGATGAKTRILLSGEKGEEIAQYLKEAGLNTTYYDLEIGKASAFKMLRSIFSKGLEAIMLEMMIAGRRAGIADDLWNDVMDFMKGNPFDRIAENWIRSHVLAYERRYYEMLQVVETMRELEVEPVMTAGTLDFFNRSLSLAFEETFHQKPADYKKVVEFMDEGIP